MKLFVPGRLCLFGEHTDWAGHYRTMNADIKPGAAIVTGIEQGIYADSHYFAGLSLDCFGKLRDDNGDGARGGAVLVCWLADKCSVFVLYHRSVDVYHAVLDVRVLQGHHFGTPEAVQFQ